MHDKHTNVREAYRRFSINEFSPNTDPTGLVPTGPFYNPQPVPTLKFAWLSRGVPLLGAPDTRVLGRFPPPHIPGLDKTNFPRIAGPHWGQQYPQLALGPVPEV